MGTGPKSSLSKTSESPLYEFSDVFLLINKRKYIFPNRVKCSIPENAESRYNEYRAIEGGNYHGNLDKSLT